MTNIEGSATCAMTATQPETQQKLLKISLRDREAVFDEDSWVEPAPEIIAAVKLDPEEDKLLEVPEGLEWSERLRVGMGEVPCPHCGSNADTPFEDPDAEYRHQPGMGPRVLWLRVRGKNGTVWLQDYICYCIKYRHLANMGVDIQDSYSAALETLKVPSRQVHRATVIERAIQQVQREPHASYVMIGPSGVGKSTMGHALLKDVCERRSNEMYCEHSFLKYPVLPSAWNAKLGQVFKEHQADAGKPFGAPDRARVTVEAITKAQKNGDLPFLLLEEIDKVGAMTEFRYGVLFDLMNAIYETKGQVFLTSIKRPKAFREFLRRGEKPDEEVQLFRRLFDRQDDPERPAYLVNLFTKDPDKLILDWRDPASWPDDDDDDAGDTKTMATTATTARTTTRRKAVQIGA